MYLRLSAHLSEITYDHAQGVLLDVLRLHAIAGVQNLHHIVTADLVLQIVLAEGLQSSVGEA